ncbi:MAG: ABC transporter permease [Cyclobacteriaceae bacterium]|nr:ABC transporter permease [Cyclobacteriaceae bacterium]
MNNNSIIPPRLPRWLLLRLLRDDLAEEVEGDLEEKFLHELKHRSAFRARLNYWYQVIQYLRPFAIRKNKATLLYYDMYQNYFRISWRSLLRQKMYSAIKIGGLAIGVAACFLISLYVKDELSYDKHLVRDNGPYRLVVQAEIDANKTERSVDFPAPAAAALKADFPEVDQAGRYLSSPLFDAYENEIRRSDRNENQHEGGFVYFDQELLELLNLRVIAGNPKYALTNPKSIVITRRKAEKYFPGEDAVGKTFIINNDDKKLYTVGAVIEDFPANSHLQFDFLMTLRGVEFWPGEQTWWMASNYQIYLTLKPGTDIEKAAENIKRGFIEKYYNPALLASGAVGFEKILNSAKFELQPMDEVYLDGSVHDSLPHGDIRFIWLFAAIAGFIVIIACINFINLSTARSANRAKEVGLRKTVGSLRSHLIRQFLTESFLFSLLAIVSGVILSWLLLPYFNVLASKSLTFPWSAWWLVPGMIVSALVIGLLAGLYPAFYLSSFNPVNVLKGNVSKGSKSSATRSMLVVFQFTTSIILIISTVVIYRQMSYILNKKLGFEKEHVLLVQGAHTLGSNVASFKSELLGLSQVERVSVSDYLPIRGSKRDGNTFHNEGMEKIERGVTTQKWVVDPDYIKTLGMKMVEGRDFNPDMISDSSSIIINQTMANQLNLADPVGKVIQNWRKYTIIGVVEDFHFESMKENIGPVCFVAGTSPSVILVKTKGDNMRETIEAISGVWARFSPNQAIRFNFLDERYAATYADVERTGRIFTTFAVLAIIVACLGLFALSAFMVEQRSKEISIRMVLGASMNTVFRLLTQNFVILVLISFAMAAPVAWILMNKWLQDFVYKTNLSWDIFLISGACALVIALVTVSYQAVRAARANPVTNLRSE